MEARASLRAVQSWWNREHGMPYRKALLIASIATAVQLIPLGLLICLTPWWIAWPIIGIYMAIVIRLSPRAVQSMQVFAPKADTKDGPSAMLVYITPRMVFCGLPTLVVVAFAAAGFIGLLACLGIAAAAVAIALVAAALTILIGLVMVAGEIVLTLWPIFLIAAIVWLLRD